MHSENQDHRDGGTDYSAIDSGEFTENGFDELELSRKLSAERMSLLVRIVKGRYHNQKVSNTPGAFTQAAVGRRMGGVEQSYISHIEHGLVDLVGTLTNYANASGLHITYEVSSAVDNQIIEDDMESDHTVLTEHYQIDDDSSREYIHA